MNPRYALPIFLLTCVLPVSAAINQPDCDVLASWTDDFTPPKSRTGPESVPAVFHDEALATMFGKSLNAWDQQDFRTLDKHMKVCQQQLFKQDRQKAKQINKVRRYLPAIQREMAHANKSASKTKDVSPQQAQLEATVDRLEKYRPSQRLVNQIALTRDVMLGKPADLEVHGLRRMPNWISQVERARASLTEVEMAPYIHRLTEREAELRAQFKKDAEAFTALQQELEAVPLTQTGFAKLRQLERSPVLGKATPQQVDGFRAEVQRKHAQIQTEMHRQQQARRSTQVQRPTGRTAGRQADAAQVSGMPDVPQYLGEVITGDDVEKAQLLGLRPGMDHQEAIRRVNKEHGLKQFTTPFLTQGYGLGARMVEFNTMDDAVGQIDYTEYFKAAIDPDAVQEALVESYGDPDEVRQAGGGRLMTWDDGDQLLQVLATNRINNAVKYTGYRGRLSLTLWSEDYAEHLEEVNEHCAEIWDKSRSDLSMNDKLYLGKHCPLMPGTKKTAGIGSLM